MPQRHLRRRAGPPRHRAHLRPGRRLPRRQRRAAALPRRDLQRARALLRRAQLHGRAPARGRPAHDDRVDPARHLPLRAHLHPARDGPQPRNHRQLPARRLRPRPTPQLSSEQLAAPVSVRYRGLQYLCLGTPGDAPCGAHPPKGSHVARTRYYVVDVDFTARVAVSNIASSYRIALRYPSPGSATCQSGELIGPTDGDFSRRPARRQSAAGAAGLHRPLQRDGQLHADRQPSVDPRRPHDLHATPRTPPRLTRRGWRPRRGPSVRRPYSP